MTAQKEELVRVDNVTSFTEFIQVFESSIAGEISCFVFPEFSFYKQQI